jgi:hypothetical protein
MKNINHFLLGLIFCFTSQALYGQGLFKRIIGSFIHDTNNAAKPRFLTYPTLAFSPETSLEFGLNSIFVYYANRDTLNRLSEISAFSFYTVKNQYGFWLDHFLYSNKDRFFFLGKIRLQNFSLLCYGIGPGTPKRYQARVDANQIWLKERVLRKIVKDFFIGFEFDYQRLSEVHFVQNSQTEIFQLPLGHQGFTNLGIGLGIVYDNRHNVLNVRKGFFRS